MDLQKKDLLLLQTGPVQEFITAARTTADLWSGSYMIAWLTAAGIRYVKEECGCEIIFPCLDNQQVYRRMIEGKGELGQPTLPNRFLAEIPHDRAREIAAGAAEAVKKELLAISQKCFQEFLKLFPASGEKYKARWDDQVARFLQISWQTAELTAEGWGETYRRLLANLAARRNARNFLQIANIPELEDNFKDALNGKDEIVGSREEWRQVCEAGKIFDSNDRPYGAMNVIKRLWCAAYLGKDIKEKSAWALHKRSNGEAKNYIAAIQMDGDRMGSILGSKDKDKKFFSRFSALLANFTGKEAEKIVKANEGELIYAGGDDVLVLLPACFAVKCAQALREKFCSDEPGMPGSEKNLSPESPRVTLSAGISFCHWKTPLAWLLEEARHAEHRAKERYDRNSLALSVIKRSGEVLHWGASFDSQAWALYENFCQLSRTEVLSGRFASALAGYLKEYKLEELPHSQKELFSSIIAADFSTVCERQASDKKSAPAGQSSAVAGLKQQSNAYIAELKKNEEISFAEFVLLFLCANFLIREGNENE